MGLYAQRGDNRQWFADHAKRISRDEARQHKVGELVAIAYIDNGSFDALAILFSKAEAGRFADGRPDAIFGLVKRELLPELK